MGFGRVTLLGILSMAMALAADWVAFRGPNSAGLAEGAPPPVEFGPGKNQVWSTPVPMGVSSPVVVDDKVFLTGMDGEELVVLAFDAANGKQVWRKDVPRERKGQFHPMHGSTTPTPTSDGDYLYVFLPEFGLLSYTLEGEERWRTPLGPFTSVQGIAGSPLVADGKVVLLIDQTVEAYVAAFDASTGKQVWKRERPTNFVGGYSTPVVYRPDSGPPQVITVGSVELTSYQLSTGEALWRMEGWLGPNSVAVVGDGLLYASEAVNQSPPPFSGFDPLDKNKDGLFSRKEAQGFSGLVHLVDRVDQNYGDGDGAIDAGEWRKAFAEHVGSGGLVAFKPGGDVVWRHKKAVPDFASALLHKGIVYTVASGGIVTSLDAKTGAVLKQGRLKGAMKQYYASPVAAGGTIFFASHDGKVSAVRAGGEWEILAVNELGEDILATPAIADGKLYVRTDETLHCFGSIRRR